MSDEAEDLLSWLQTMASDADFQVGRAFHFISPRQAHKLKVEQHCLIHATIKSYVLESLSSICESSEMSLK